MSFANLNLSIRWKMLAGFLISALLPCILISQKVSLKWTVAISITVSLVLALIGIVRIMKILNKIQTALGEEELSRQDEKDELRLIDESLDHFTDYFSKTRIDFDGTDMDQTNGTEVGSVKKSYKAGLVTGEPAAGEIYVLPSSTNVELVTSARLVGGLAQQVFDKAVQTVIEDLNNLKTLGGLTESDQAIIDFQVIILHDPSLIMEVEQSLKAGENLLATISRTFEAFIDKLKGSDNIYMKGRIYDFNDLRQRLFDAIHKATGQESGDRFSGAKGKIAACRHVLPSEVISLHNAGAIGIISRENTPSSHAQILLSSLNMPSASSIEDLPISKLTGHRALINILKGTVNIDPSEKRVKSTIEEFENRKADIIEGPVTLKSGESINIGVTVNNPRIEAAHAKEVSPDFVGLFRTEMHFIGKKALPTEEELIEDYSSLINSFKNQLVVIRMLDLGGDKISGYESVAATEENPCMGRRSMRLLLESPELFRLQLRAILKSSHDQVCLLYPMISGWEELELIDDFLEKTIKELKNEGVKFTVPSKGIMVEVPSIVTRFEDYVDHFDVFNIGTNDLTQYALAADRNNDAVSRYYKPCHPSVLAMIEKVARLCREKGKKAIICGQMGSDEKMLPLLIGLGIENISVNWPNVSRIKKAVTELTKDYCQDTASQAIKCKSVKEVEKVVSF